MAEYLLRAGVWVVRKIGAGTVFEWLLLVFLTLALLTGLSQVVAHLDVGRLVALGMVALLYGWWIGRSRVSGGWASVGAVLLGATLIIGDTAQTLARGGSLLREAAVFVIAWLGWLRGGAFPDGLGVEQAWVKTIEGIAVVLGRLVVWATSLLHRQPVFDAIATSMAWSFAIWLVLCSAAWTLRQRRQPLLAILPPLAFLATSLALARGKTWSLVAMLGVALVLMAWMHYQAKMQSWLKEGIDYIEGIPLTLSFVAFGMVAVLLAIASFAPAFRIARIASSFQRLIEEYQPGSGSVGKSVLPGGRPQAARQAESNSFSESLGLEVNRPAPPVDYLQEVPAGGLPREHLLGSGPELKEKQVFRVRVEPGSTNKEVLPPGRHYYWRLLTYDRYIGSGWLSSPAEEVRYLASHPALSTSLQGEQLVVQDVQSLGAAQGLNGLFVNTGEPVSIDKDFVVGWRYRKQAAGEAGDVFGVSVPAGTEPARAYQAISLVSVASTDQLRQAGTNYPAWVRQRFLDLPGEVPERVYQLARDLTAPEPTPYDQAMAIESYLRGFPYTLDTGLPPANQDVVDYFLFTLKRGYCDYYASAMVVLARAAGIPARLAVGYASGSYDPQNQSYTVTEADAHSWAELYFPGYGWIDFEPTASQPGIERPGIATNAPPPQLPQPPKPFLVLPRLDWGRLGLMIFSTMLAVLSGWLGWAWSEPWRFRRLSPKDCLLRIYVEILRYGESLKALEGASHTPREVAEAIAQRLVRVRYFWREGRDLSQLTDDLRLISDLYSREIYGPQPAGRREQLEAVEAWGRARLYLWWGITIGRGLRAFTE